MRRFLVLLPLFFLLAEAQAQRLMQRKRPDLIPLEGQVKRIGWFVEPGIAYTLPRFKNEEEILFHNADTMVSFTYDPNGRFGIYIGAGLTWFTRDPVIVDYFDLGIAYKNLRGTESYERSVVLSDSTSLSEGYAWFAERRLTVSANANKFIQTGDYQFVQLSLGANADIDMGAESDFMGQLVSENLAFPPGLIGQMHFKLGYGFKLRSKLLLIPAIETPVFSIEPADQGFGKLQWFHSTYRPIIFSVRFLFLRARNGFDCPPPIRHNEFEKEYKQDGYHPK